MHLVAPLDYLPFQRLMQRADGYVATIVSGAVVRREGTDTGARPGRLVRGAQRAGA